MSPWTHTDLEHGLLEEVELGVAAVGDAHGLPVDVAARQEVYGGAGEVVGQGEGRLHARRTHVQVVLGAQKLGRQLGVVGEELGVLVYVHRTLFECLQQVTK